MTNIIKDIVEGRDSFVETKENDVLTKVLFNPDYENLADVKKALSSDGGGIFDKLAEQSSQLSMEEFLVALKNYQKEKKIDIDLASQLKNQVKKLQPHSNPFKEIFAANLKNSASNQNEKVTDYLNELFVSLLKHSSKQTLESEDIYATRQYVGIASASLGQEVEDLFHSSYIQHNLIPTRDNDWFNPIYLTPIMNNTKWQCESIEEMLKIIKDSLYIESVDGIIMSNCIKQHYLSTDDKDSIGFCKDDIIQDYKACLVLAHLIDKLGTTDNNYIGYNLLSKTRVDELITFDNRPMSAVKELAKAEEEAREIANDILGIEKKKQIAVVAKEESPVTEEKRTNQKFTTFDTILNQKIRELSSVILKLEKYTNRTKLFEGPEQELEVLAQEFGIKLVENDEPRHRKAYFEINRGLVKDAAQKRLADTMACKHIFAYLRKAYGYDMTMEEINKAFDVFDDLSTPYVKGLINEFYMLIGKVKNDIDSQPMLKANKLYKQRIPAHIAIDMKNKVEEGSLLYDVFKAYKPSKKALETYEEESEIE